MKGLEPSTFCMASRRSSQLSYIREGADYSPAASPPSCRTVQRMLRDRAARAFRPSHAIGTDRQKRGPLAPMKWRRACASVDGEQPLPATRPRRGTESDWGTDMSREPRKELPIGGLPWAGTTKDRLIAKPTIETSPEIERLVTPRRRARQGGRSGSRALPVLRYADNVYGYVRTIVRDHHDAEDVTQQVFAKLITAIAKYEQRGVPFVAWLLRMSHNAAVDAIRSQRMTPTAEIFDPDVATYEDPPERARSLRTALAALPEDQREVVVLRHVLGLSPVEIAQQLGRSNSSVYGLHHRGRRAMCAKLERLDSVPLTAARGRLPVAA